MNQKISLHRTQRAGSAKETALRRVLAVGAMALAAAYAVGLIFLLVRGGSRLWSLTLHPTPLSGVDNEETMRFVVATCLFGIAAWVVVSIVEPDGERHPRAFGEIVGEGAPRGSGR